MNAGVDRPIGVVVVGTSFGVLAHVRALQAVGMDVLAVVGRDAAKAADRAGRFGVPLGTSDLAAALALPGVDVVAVTTPPHTHASIVYQAIDAGKHVVCEKPFARDTAEAIEMLNAAERAGVIHLLGTEWRFATGQAQFTRTLRSGAVGTPQFAVFELHNPSHADPTAALPPWWELESEGGGWLGTHATHVIDQIRTAMGEVVSVSAFLQRLSDRPSMTADDTYTAILRLDNGAIALIHSSCAVLGPFLAVKKVVGTVGTAWLEGNQVWTDTGTGPTKLPIPDDLPAIAAASLPGGLVHTAYDEWNAIDSYLEPYARLYLRLQDMIAGRAFVDDPVAATFVDGVASQRVLDAIRASSHNDGAWTPVAST